MKYRVNALCCGSNQSGLSVAISVNSCSEYAADSSLRELCLVNCGDSTLKFCNTIKKKLNNLRLIIVSSLAPHNVSGIPGILLSLSDLGTPKVTVVGPSGIKDFVQMFGVFVNRRLREFYYTSLCCPILLLY